MSDFDIDKLAMQDEEGTEDVSPDLEAERAALAKQREELAKKEKDLNRGFMEIAEREKKLTVPPKEDELPDVPPEAAKILDAYIGKKLTPLEQKLERTYYDGVNAELERQAEKAGIPPEEILKVATELHLAPADDSISAARDVFVSAANIIKGRTSVPDELKTKLREEILEELAKEGVRVEGVRKTRELPDEEPDEEALSPKERYELIKKKVGLA